MRQPMIPRYRFTSPIKTPCCCPHMSRPQLLICSPRFSTWLINKCPCNFAQLVSHSSHRLNREEKHIPFWCTSEGTQTPHQVVLITVRRLYRSACQWPPSFGPTAAGLCTPDKCCCHQTPPHIISDLLLFCPSFLLFFITYVHSFALSPRPLPSPLVFLHFCSLFIPSCNQIMVTPCWC